MEKQITKKEYQVAIRDLRASYSHGELSEKAFKKLVKLVASAYYGQKLDKMLKILGRLSMETIDYISTLIDLKIELNDLEKIGTYKGSGDPAVFPSSILEEKEKEIRTSIEDTKRLITQYLEEE